MEVHKNQAEVNWQDPMVHKYPPEANKCRRMRSTPSRRMDVNKNPAEVHWLYRMVYKSQVEANWQ